MNKTSFYGKRFFIPLAAISVITLSLIGCIEKPMAVRNAQSNFSHDEILRGSTSCLSCHESKRPIAPHPQNKDCLLCHAVGSGWKDGQRSTQALHTPTPASCTRCHETRRPAPRLGRPHGDNRDCTLCHRPDGRWKDGKDGMKQVHTSKTDACASCHIAKSPTGFAGVTHGQGEDCNRCHRTDSWKSMKEFFHAPELSHCASCHESRRQNHGFNLDCAECHLRGERKWKELRPFEHSRMYGSGADVPRHCSECHATRRPKEIRKPQPLTGHFDESDCQRCHVTPNMSARPWKFRHSGASFKPVEFCLPCHESAAVAAHLRDNPEYLKPPEDCSRCHSLGVGEPKNWRRGFFSR